MDNTIKLIILHHADPKITICNVDADYLEKLGADYFIENELGYNTSWLSYVIAPIDKTPIDFATPDENGETTLEHYLLDDEGRTTKVK